MNMTKITCIGDSIRIQYTPRVREMLGEDFEVYAPAENCRYSKFTLRGLYDWKADMTGSRIVHWNNGLWDVCELFDDGPFATVEEYVANMLRVADILLSRHEAVIFATTTPVSPINPHTKNEEVKRYNDALVPRLIERGVIINDLHSLVVADLGRYISSDKTHLTPEGIEMCARATTDAILAAYKSLPAAKAENTPDHFDDTGVPIEFTDGKK
jgi:lysophospholipase L1-like esterase